MESYGVRKTIAPRRQRAAPQLRIPHSAFPPPFMHFFVSKIVFLHKKKPTFLTFGNIAY